MTHLIELSVEQTGENYDCMSALALDSKREAIVPSDELEDMIDDIPGFVRATFENGFSQVVSIDSDDWDGWLEMFEVFDLDDIAPDFIDRLLAS